MAEDTRGFCSNGHIHMKDNETGLRKLFSFTTPRKKGMISLILILKKEKLIFLEDFN